MPPCGQLALERDDDGEWEVPCTYEAGHNGCCSFEEPDTGGRTKQDLEEQCEATIVGLAKKHALKVQRISPRWEAAGIGSCGVRVADERFEPRPYTITVDPNDRSDADEQLRAVAARMRGIALVELLNGEWALDQLDPGQLERLERAQILLAEHLDNVAKRGATVATSPAPAKCERCGQ